MNENDGELTELDKMSANERARFRWRKALNIVKDRLVKKKLNNVKLNDLYMEEDDDDAWETESKPTAEEEKGPSQPDISERNKWMQNLKN